MRQLLNLGRELSIIAGALLVFVMSASVAMYLMLRQPAVRTPALVGKPLSEAERMAEQAGLKLQVRNTLYDERHPAQVIIEQWPPPGMSVRRGQPLRVNVSLGPRPSDRTPLPEAAEREAIGSGEPPPLREAERGRPHPLPSPPTEERGEPSSPRRPER